MENEQLTDREIRIKKLKFRAWHRGFREHDFIMGTYADENLDKLSDDELDQFEALLAEQDWDAYYWIIKQVEAPEQFKGKVLTELQSLAAMQATIWVGDIKS